MPGAFFYASFMKRFKERRDGRGKWIGNRNDTRVFQHKSNNTLASVFQEEME